jgi:hypothetical protein
MQEIKRVNEKKTTLNGRNNVKCYGLFHIILIFNGHIPFEHEHVMLDWHIPLGGSIGLYVIEMDLV